MIHVETDDRKLAQFIAQRLSEGWTVTGVSMTGPIIETATGEPIEGQLIDRACWRWVNARDWRRIFKPRVRLKK